MPHHNGLVGTKKYTKEDEVENGIKLSHDLDVSALPRNRISKSRIEIIARNCV